jgi:transposase
MQKNYSNVFKFKVVMEVIRGDLTIAEVISKYQISKSVIHKWKKQFLDNGSKVFNHKGISDKQEEVSVEKLHATIGKLKVENDFLHAAWNRVKPQ